MPELSQYSQHATLRDGTAAVVRAIRPDDKQQLLSGFHRLSGKSAYFRFLGARRELTEQELIYLTEVDFIRHVALVVALTGTEVERPIGVGRYIESDGNTSQRSAEIAFAVDDQYQHLGVGTLLFEHIVSIAQGNGIDRLQADVMSDNTAMLEIFSHSGLSLETSRENSVMHIECRITGQAFNRYYSCQPAG